MRIKIPDALFLEYLADPIATDAKVRKECYVPDNRYFTVSKWPDAGWLTVDKTRFREVAAKKISKSDAK